MNKSLYQELAYYYHLTEGGKSDDLPFYIQLAQIYGSPILDYGCGSGRVSIALAREGYTVYSLDPSFQLLEIMLNMLQKDAIVNDKIRIISLDLLQSIPPISLCILAYNTFNEITDQNKQEDLLKILAKVLQPSGILAMEILPVFDYWPYLKLEQSISLEDGKGTLLSYIQFQPESDTDLFRTTCIFEQLTESGQVEKKVIGETIRRQISLGEISRLLNWAGFEIKETFESYNMKQPRNKCLLVAQPVNTSLKTENK